MSKVLLCYVIMITNVQLQWFPANVIIDDEEDSVRDGNTSANLNHSKAAYDTLTGVFMTEGFSSTSRYRGQIHRRTVDIFHAKVSFGLKPSDIAIRT